MIASHAAFLGAAPAPPHDPRRLVLDHRAGWRTATLDGVELATVGCGPPALALVPLPDAVLALAAADGSFGGLVPPRTLALAPDGSLVLLDPATARLRRFDGCDCRFRDVPHTGGPGRGARNFDQPGGIAACGDMLLVADAGNARISVFGFYGYVLRGHWTPPAGWTATPWRPVAVAAMRGRIVVADPANGALHFLTPAGRFLAARSGFGAVHAVAFDRQGRVWAASEGEEAVRVVAWPDGQVVATQTSVEGARGAFARSSIRRGRSGALDLGPFCISGGQRLFDLSGAPLAPEEGGGAARFGPSGVYGSAALDSRLYRCQWDRLELDLDMPRGCAARALIHTSEVLKSDAEIALLPPEAWSATPWAAAASVADGGWDALIRAEPGRYLWLRLELASDGAATPRIRSAAIGFPRISLRRYLPAVFGEEPVSADFTDRFLAIFDRGLRDIEARIDSQADLFDPLSAPAAPAGRDFLGWLASWIGVTLDRQLPLRRRRLILKSAGRLFALRGTRTGLREMLELYLGLGDRACAPRRPCCGPCVAEAPPVWTPPGLILEHFTLRRWLFVGTGRLGDAARLWGAAIVNRAQLGGAAAGPQSGAQLGISQLKTFNDPLRDPFHVYAHRFSVFLPGWIARLPGRRRMVERLIRAESPAHAAAQIEWVEPRFRVGVQAMIGFDAVIGRYPQGVELGRDRLGKATVLPSADGRDRPPAPGRRGRIGGGVL